MTHHGYVVFTGKGIDPVTGKLRTREDWCALGRAKGFDADPKNTVSYSTRYLVASRDDTKKAAKARHLGVQVISYNQFYAMCKGVETDNAMFSAAPVEIDTAGMEEVDGWGIF